MNFDEKKIEGIKLLEDLEKTLGKKDTSNDVSPNKSREDSNSRERRGKIVRKESGNTARAVVFRSKRKNDSGERNEEEVMLGEEEVAVEAVN